MRIVWSRIKYDTVVALWIDEKVVWRNLSPNRLVNSFWMSGETFDKQPGFPETESRFSLISGSKVSKYFNSNNQFPGLGPLTSDSRLPRREKFFWARNWTVAVIRSRISLQFLAALAIYFWRWSSITPLLITHVPTLSILEMLSDVQSYFRDPECEGLGYARL
jgi:hypothetical protein